MRAPRPALLAACILLPACVSQAPAPEMPALAAMQRDSTQSVNISLGSASLGFLGFLSRFAGEHDPDSAAARDLLRGLYSVQVHNFQFATDHAYGQSDLAALRARLDASNWRHIVQVRDSGRSGDVDVYCTLDNHVITRLVVLAAEPREFTLVNIVGRIDPEQIARLSHTFVPHEHGRPTWELARDELTQLSLSRR